MRRGARPARAAGAVAAVAALLASAGCGGQEGAPPPHPKASPPPSSWDRAPDSVAAVGDSITTGFDSCQVLSDCPGVSWSTGDSPEVRSLASRLLGRARAASHSWNFAETGARMSDLGAQMRQAAERRPGLVTVLVGANDACRGSVRSMTPVETFRDQFASALRTLRERSPKSQVYVASIPDLKRLWEVGQETPMGREVWKLGICPTMLGEAEAMDRKADERRGKVRDRVEEYNEALAEVCARDERCRTDGGAVYAYRFGARQLSRWDLFHPSVDGQARLADIAYRAVTA
ncbi:SGNH/GDSL hydrolase family protein [Streptomyces sp. NPDC005012]|uniref:SGNH/GDSL hydrolase family protein n=1 Tax=unclassified Streptomyces TaxID=2593676 RepID=UPI0033B3CE4C